jgi:hypothetical protein
MSFDAVAALLRISTKYDANVLRRRAFEYLEVVYPLDYGGFQRYYLTPEDYLDPRPEQPDPFRALELALAWDAQWLLPVIMYRCATRWNALFRRSPHMRLSAPDELSKRAYERLDTAWRLTVAEGSARLEYCTGTLILGQLRGGSREDCRKARGMCRQVAMLVAGNLSRLGAEPLEMNPEDVPLFDDMCESCGTVCSMIARMGKKKLWDEIPGLFGLPSWEKLKAMRDAELLAAW